MTGLLMNTMLASSKDALLIPLPQYPIYTALLAQLGAQAVFYTMDENNGQLFVANPVDLSSVQCLVLRAASAAVYAPVRSLPL